MRGKRRFYQIMAVLLIPALLLGTVADIAAAFQSRQLRGNVIGAAEGEVVLAAEGGADTGSLYAYGTLGQGLHEEGLLPYGIDLFSEVCAISAGRNHSLALMESGDVYSWGYGANGCLGHGDLKERLAPQKIETLKGVRQVSAGGHHSLALLENGEVYAFGYNSNGQLGTKDTATRLEPAKVALPPGQAAVQVAAGYKFTLVLMEDGTVWSCGQNNYGQLGLGRTDTQSDANPEPKMIESESLPGKAVEISAGKEHALVVLENGDVYSFGRNHYGQLGLGYYGDDKNKNTPQKLARGIGAGKLPADIPAVRVTAAAAGGPEDGAHSLILLENGDIYSCGRGTAGRLGLGDNTARYFPTKVVISGRPKMVSISAGGKHSLAIDEKGQVYACGENDYGQLGLGEVTEKNVFTPVTGVPVLGDNPAAAVSGSAHSLVLMKDGTVYSFGLNNHGQLGQGTTVSLKMPALLRGFEHVKTASAGGTHSLLLLENGRVFSCGLNNYGQLGHGDDTARLLPVEINGLPKDIRVAAIAAGRYHSLAVLENGEVYSLGYGEFGQLGHANNQNYAAPRKVVHLTNIVAISAGRNHSAAVNTKGEVFTFGLGSYGRLGHGEEVSYLYPKKIEAGLPEGLPDPKENPAVAVAAGGSHTLVLVANGDVYSCGRNLYGELGLGDTDVRPVPTKIEEGLPGPATAIAAGKAAGIEDGMHSLVLLENGAVYSFGHNDYGQLGLGDTADRSMPTMIEEGLPSAASAVAAGGRHSLVLLKNGALYSCGDNEYGQLGLGDKQSRYAPVEIEELAGKEIKSMDAGGEHSLTVSDLGPAYSFGNTADGRIGRVPLQPETAGPGNLKSVAAGDGHILIALEDGSVYAYGYGLNGRLGHGDEYDRYEPVKIEGLPSAASAVAAGGGHSLVLLKNGEVYSFGHNEYGQLGVGDTADRSVPTKITGLPDPEENPAVAAAAGGGHSLVVLENGDVYSFGRNEYGQLGLGHNDDCFEPTMIEEGLPDPEENPAVAVSAGGGHSLVLSADGAACSFGCNDAGQLGPGEAGEPRLAPMKIEGLSPIKAVAAGCSFTVLASRSRETEVVRYRFAADDNAELKEDVEGVVDTAAGEIRLTVPHGTELSALVADFELSYGAQAYVGETWQEPGVAANAFSGPATYTIVAEDGVTARDWTVTVEYAPNVEAEIETYIFTAANNKGVLEHDVEGTIDGAEGTVTLTVPYGTELGALIADFELSYGAQAYVGDTRQEMGVTANDFTAPAIYRVVAEDGTTERDWTVTVEYAPNVEAEFLAYGFKDLNTETVIDGEVGQIAVTVPFGTEVNGLTAVFELSYGAQAYVDEMLQETGVTANDFSGPVTYTITAEDGETSRDWTVTVTIAPNDKAEFLRYRFTAAKNDEGNLEHDVEGVIDDESGMITLTVPYKTVLNNLIASFTLSYGAEAEVGETPQVSGVTANDFEEPVIYKVVAMNGTDSKDWTLTVEKESPGTETDILAFGFRAADNAGVLEADVCGVIAEEEGQVHIEVPYGTDVSALVADFELSPEARVKVEDIEQASGETPNDFTAPIIYRVVAEDGTTERDWTVTVEFLPNDEAEFLSFGFTGPKTVRSYIDAENGRITVAVPHDTVVNNLVADFTLSYGAQAHVGDVEQVSGETPNDFATPITYSVAAEDGVTTREWTVTVREFFDEAALIGIRLTREKNPHLNLEKDIDGALTDEKSFFVEVPEGTDVNALVADFELSSGARAYVDVDGEEVEQISGLTALDFTEPVIYRIIAENGETEREWTVIIAHELPLSNEAEITSYRFLKADNPHLRDDVVGEIDAQNHKVRLKLHYGTDGSALIADFELSPEAIAKVEAEGQESGETPNFFFSFDKDEVKPGNIYTVNYTVVAQNGREQIWRAELEIIANDEAEILTYGFSGVKAATVIDGEKRQITATVPFGTDASKLKAVFELSPGAQAFVAGVIQVSGSTVNDFTAPVKYAVRAQDENVSKNWTVSVKVSPNDKTDFLYFAFSKEDNPALKEDAEGEVDADGGRITFTLPSGTDVRSLTPYFDLSYGADTYVGKEKQESGVTANDFSDPVIYRVVAEDGETVRAWTVEVNLELCTEAEIISFGFNGKKNPDLKKDLVGTVDRRNGTVDFWISPIKVLQSLIADFELSLGAAAYVGDLPQTTGITANDFRSPVTYLVSAEAGNRKEWRVSIFLYGDVNLDKKVDVGDAILVLKHI
ncbi:MAG: hypothetical protein WAO23_01870, partial [Dethiobacteria bacterium]